MTRNKYNDQLDKYNNYIRKRRKNYKETKKRIRSLFGKITHISADDIYATNKNRKYSTRAKIVTNFKRKGRAGKYEDQRQIISRELRKERTIRMEGSFGTEKEHYGLQRIKARTNKTEISKILFSKILLILRFCSYS